MIYYILIKIMRWLEHYNCYFSVNYEIRCPGNLDRDDYYAWWDELDNSISRLNKLYPALQYVD